MTSLAQHIPPIPEPFSLTLLVGTRETPVTFLIHYYLHHCIREGLKVCFVSFSKTLDEHTDALRKWGTDVRTKPNFYFVDGYSMLFAPAVVANKIQANDVKNNPKQVFAPVIKCLQQNEFDTKNSILIIEDIDVLLSTNSLQATQLQEAVFELQKTSGRVVVNVSVGAPLPRQVSFAKNMGHLATRCISCRPLTSGNARRITGFMRVTKGPNHFLQRSGHELPEDDDNEVLYEVTETHAVIHPKGQVTLQL
ncbi:elongator complex subunit Elp6 [Schizosaccharomyces osmophilus]|uniref:Elongator complex subunit Elp6 n=1 Tax=Schizosaccharomyces osmophilus TaxID=2545709 RepID=A0AAF0AY15_9SCHI|nr:elongator complex subunit Elp6 [Schizosaccharomyces osmophilus]WBW74284.1 elongator complex subunit Elp6 [Schizosaccharomyces osmophilus]